MSDKTKLRPHAGGFLRRKGLLHSPFPVCRGDRLSAWIMLAGTGLMYREIANAEDAADVRLPQETKLSFLSEAPLVGDESQAEREEPVMEPVAEAPVTEVWKETEPESPRITSSGLWRGR